MPNTKYAPGARARARSANYAQTRVNAHKSREPWTDAEDKLVIAHTTTDRELSAAIGRSVQAIQVRRTRIIRDYHPDGCSDCGHLGRPCGR